MLPPLSCAAVRGGCQGGVEAAARWRKPPAMGGGCAREWRLWTGASEGRSRDEDSVGKEEDDTFLLHYNAILIIELQGWPDCALLI